ncbi:MAG: rbsK [Klenkia sp.]|nr:rbsK [Klenkia sp.]
MSTSGAQVTGPIAVAVVGSVNLDLITVVDHLPLPGETQLATSDDEGLGGKGANQAAAAARAGARTALVAAVGHDDAGALCRRELDRLAVDTTQLQVVTAVATGRAIVIVDTAGENTIVVSSGANASLAPDHVEQALAALPLGPGSVLVSQGEVSADVVDAVGRFAGTHDLRWVLNLAPVIDVDVATLTRAWLVVVNEGELSDLWAQLIDPVQLPPAQGPPGPVQMATAVAESLGVQVLVTRGAHGCLHVRDRVVQEFPAHPVERVVDTTGAGDTFVGTFSAAIAGGAEIDTAVAAASRAAATLIASLGASPRSP